MRYNDDEHLRRFGSGTFPTIHDDIFTMFVSNVLGQSVLDLGCCFGLLGERIARAGWRAVGVDALAWQLDKGRAAGVTIPLFQLKVGENTLADLLRLVAEHAVDTVVARRSLCVILAGKQKHEANEPLAAALARGLAERGVRELVIQGMAPDPRAVAALKSVDDEIAILAPAFALAQRRGEVAYLRAV
ncbi:MAG: class I SAM-dependent methyltransferase [Rhodocyclaceae bacterium]|nr:MAG: class I SAM-dependent methyltransferase [Rhodocyclaceae bacterium]